MFWPSHDEIRIKDALPWRLRKAKLVLNEQDIYTHAPFPLHGRPDQVFLLPNGRCVVMDTKTCEQQEVFLADIIQLSVYRYILTHGYGQKVDPYGYVRLARIIPGRAPRVRFRRVRLLGDLAIHELWREYNAIRNGEYQPPCRCGGQFH